MGGYMLIVSYSASHRLFAFFCYHQLEMQTKIKSNTKLTHLDNRQSVETWVYFALFEINDDGHGIGDLLNLLFYIVQWLVECYFSVLIFFANVILLWIPLQIWGLFSQP